jgi:hypothetical protein
MVPPNGSGGAVGLSYRAPPGRPRRSETATASTTGTTNPITRTAIPLAERPVSVSPGGAGRATSSALPGGATFKGYGEGHGLGLGEPGDPGVGVGDGEGEGEANGGGGEGDGGGGEGDGGGGEGGNDGLGQPPA